MSRVAARATRGHVTAEEIAANTKALIDADAPSYAKIIDVSQAKSELTREPVATPASRFPRRW